VEKAKTYHGKCVRVALTPAARDYSHSPAFRSVAFAGTPPANSPDAQRAKSGLLESQLALPIRAGYAPRTSQVIHYTPDHLFGEKTVGKPERTIMAKIRIVEKKNYEDLTAKRDKLFQEFVKNPKETHLALEIKVIDDKIAKLRAQK
jgi:hypothetical protein